MMRQTSSGGMNGSTSPTPPTTTSTTNNNNGNNNIPSSLPSIPIAWAIKIVDHAYYYEDDDEYINGIGECSKKYWKNRRTRYILSAVLLVVLGVACRGVVLLTTGKSVSASGVIQEQQQGTGGGDDDPSIQGDSGGSTSTSRTILPTSAPIVHPPIVTYDDFTTEDHNTTALSTAALEFQATLTSDVEFTFFNSISNVADWKSMIESQTSPQRRAWDWLLSELQSQNPIVDNQAIVQRYCIATIFFLQSEQSIINWFTGEDPPASADECEWILTGTGGQQQHQSKGVIGCNDQGKITGLRLGTCHCHCRMIWNAWSGLPLIVCTLESHTLVSLIHFVMAAPHIHTRITKPTWSYPKRVGTFDRTFHFVSRQQSALRYTSKDIFQFRISS